MIKTKRVYEVPARTDGFRILVDRLWPRGLSKNQAKLDLWLKDAAPSTALRTWFGHDRERWDEFRRRYFKELHDKEDAIETIMATRPGKTVTLVYGAKDEQYNNAVALKEFIEQHIGNSKLRGNKMS
jgi:uncharacterized protein YeaO (DUF488 family)